MSTRNDQTLQQAFDLIEANKFDEARTILQPLLESDKDNPDVWWIYAHAVQDPEEARKALRTITQLDPTYPGATDLMETLQARFPSSTSGSGIRSLSRSAASAGASAQSPAEDDDLDFDTGDEEELISARRTINLRRLLIPLAGFVVVVVLIVVVLAIANPSQPSATQTPVPETPTQVVAVDTGTPGTGVETPTEVPTVAETATEVIAQTVPSDTPQPIITDTEIPQTTPEPATATPGASGSGDFTTIQNALTEFTLAPAGIQTRQTVLGSTVIVSVCTTITEQGTTLSKVMGIVAKLSNGVQADAIGVQLMNCDDQTPLRTIAVKMQDAQSYAAGTLTDRDFQLTWKPVE